MNELPFVSTLLGTPFNTGVLGSVVSTTTVLFNVVVFWAPSVAVIVNVWLPSARYVLSPLLLEPTLNVLVKLPEVRVASQLLLVPSSVITTLTPLASEAEPVRVTSALVAVVSPFVELYVICPAVNTGSFLSIHTDLLYPFSLPTRSFA